MKNNPYAKKEKSKNKNNRDHKNEKKEIKKEIFESQNNHTVKRQETYKEIQVIYPVE
jgi:hypothetical protein